jgi:hypothetical protein
MFEVILLVFLYFLTQIEHFYILPDIRRFLGEDSGIAVPADRVTSTAQGKVSDWASNLAAVH